MDHVVLNNKLLLHARPKVDTDSLSMKCRFICKIIDKAMENPKIVNIYVPI